MLLPLCLCVCVSSRRALTKRPPVIGRPSHSRMRSGVSVCVRACCAVVVGRAAVSYLPCTVCTHRTVYYTQSEAIVIYYIYLLYLSSMPYLCSVLRSHVAPSSSALRKRALPPPCVRSLSHFSLSLSPNARSVLSFSVRPSLSLFAFSALRLIYKLTEFSIRAVCVVCCVLCVSEIVHKPKTNTIEIGNRKQCKANLNNRRLKIKTETIKRC